MQQAGGSALTRHSRTQGQKLARSAPKVAPDVLARLWKKADPDDKPFLAELFSHVPAFIAHRIIGEWENVLEQRGRREANLYLLTVRDELLPELFPKSGLPFHASDGEIADLAERAVNHLRARLRPGMKDPELFTLLAQIAHRYAVEVPGCATASGKRARMLDAAWWRRAFRKRFQAVEHAAIKVGCVHKRAAPYVSDEAMRRHERHARRIARLLESLEAVNESTGEVMPLDEAAASSFANPEIRRVAMLTCVKGLEARASELGLVGVFLTITCPSRMHARHWIDGKANETYDGTSPRGAQAYLARKVWNAATRKLKHQGIAPGAAYFGLRVVEPHHDATPHWHLLAFVEARHLEVFLETLRDYALRDSANEPGAQERRFKIERIDPRKGSAVGYVAKYVSKSIDGHGVGEDLEAGKPANSTAARIVVCARIWNWRQFQFFGVGAVTPFRELYRLKGLPQPLEALLLDLWRAAKDGDFAGFLRAREEGQMRLATFRRPEPSRRYPGETGLRLRGIVFQGGAGPIPVITRPDDWSIRQRPDRDRGSLGLDSITPRDIDLTGIFSAPDNRKSGSGKVENHCQARPRDRDKRRKQGVLQLRLQGGKEGGGEIAPNRAPLPGQGHSQWG